MHVWDAALERVIAVVAGCSIGLLITFIYHFKEKTGEKKIIYQDEA